MNRQNNVLNWIGRIAMVAALLLIWSMCSCSTQYVPVESVRYDSVFFEKIRKDIEKTKEKIAEQQKRLRTLEAQLAEEENLEIVRMVKAVKMDNKELTAFLKAYASGLISLPEDMMVADSGADAEDEMEGYADEA